MTLLRITGKMDFMKYQVQSVAIFSDTTIWSIRTVWSEFGVLWLGQDFINFKMRLISNKKKKDNYGKSLDYIQYDIML